MKKYAMIIPAFIIFSSAHANDEIFDENVRQYPSYVVYTGKNPHNYIQKIQSLLGSAIHKIAHDTPLSEDEARLITKLEKMAENYRIRWGHNIGWSALLSILFNIQFFPLLGLFCLYDITR